MRAHPLFEGMHFSENWDELYTWMPLVMAGMQQPQSDRATRCQSVRKSQCGVATYVGAASGYSNDWWKKSPVIWPVCWFFYQIFKKRFVLGSTLVYRI